MNIKHIPATPLPWTWETLPSFVSSKMREPEYLAKVNQDDAYKVHACNAYPKLVTLLHDIQARWHAGSSLDEIKYAAEDCKALLKELGEL